jgi:hypothetical protein
LAPLQVARSAHGKAKTTIKLLFRVTDGSGEGKGDDPGPQVQRYGAEDADVGVGPAKGAVRPVGFKAPTKAGQYRFCVTATDRMDNVSSESCAKLTVTR